MSTDRWDDRDLREAFAVLREEDRRRAPSYADLRGGFAPRAPSRQRSRVVWGTAAAAGVATLVVAAWVAGWRDRGADDLDAAIAFAREIGAWSAPTDAFQRLVPSGIPDSVPGLDVGSAYVPDAFAAGEDRFEAAGLAADVEEAP